MADPRLFARRKLQEKHHIPDKNVFDGKRYGDLYEWDGIPKAGTTLTL